jgi:hypothetical protein
MRNIWTWDDDLNEWDNYREWLLHRINFHKKQYSKLMEIMHNYPYVVYVYMDRNRYEDGVYQRAEYYRDADLPPGALNMCPCSVLEMLVGFAKRIDDEWIGCDYGEDPHPQDFFFEMICNLGLKEATNSRISSAKVVKILDIWIKREFDSDGNGSVFPIKNPQKDQRNTELWCQFQEYFHENSARFV